MKTKLLCKLVSLLVACLFLTSAVKAQSEVIPTGSFIVNMGVTPQTYGNGIKPWGMVHELIKNHRAQILWVINPLKTKDGIDFTHNGINYKGGTFIILKKYRTAEVNARIAYWQTQGVIGITTTSEFIVNVSYTLKYTPRWTFDFQNGNIAINFLNAAGIPSAEFPKKYPANLNSCDDLFVMPHADPTWETHNNLLNWNLSNRGWIWAGCHAVSVLENIVNPSNPLEQMNFLSLTGLVPFGSHADGSPPYKYRFPADPEMQFIGIADEAMQNGSEQVFLPKKYGGWRPGTQVAGYDTTQQNVPTLSPGEAAAIVYGRAFDDINRGKVLYTGGHDINKGNADAVAAMRVFFNYSFMSVYEKALSPDIVGPVNITALNSYIYKAQLPIYANSANYSYLWSSSCGGTFSNPFDSVTYFTAPSVMDCSDCVITCTVYDVCGRQYYQDKDVEICASTPPVALDRQTPVILNPDGTGPQKIGDPIPLAGTDEDGFVVSYVLKSLPSGGVLMYDHDNNASTSDIIINSLMPSEELILTLQQMKSLKFDPNDGYDNIASFLYTVIDNSNLRDLTPATYTIPVNPPPDAITKISPPVASRPEIATALPMQANDNGTIISYTILELPPSSQCIVYINNVPAVKGQVLTPAQATQITYKPTGNYVGYSEILYTATDNEEVKDNTPATLTLQMVNQPPVAKNITAPFIASPVGTIQYSLPPISALDSDGNVESFIITAKPDFNQGVLYFNSAGSTYSAVSDNLTLTMEQAATLKFDPKDNFSGMASFKYSAKDNQGLVDSKPATYFIPVQLIPPVANDVLNNSIYSGAGWQTISSPVGTSPVAGRTVVSYKIITIPDAAKEGTLSCGTGGTPDIISAGQILTPVQVANMKFNPNKGFTGMASFTFTCTDNTGLTNESPAMIRIPVHNSAPDAVEITNVSIANTSGQVTLSPLAASDPDQEPITGHSFIITSLPNPKTGILFLNNNPVQPGQTISVMQSSTLEFIPAPGNKDTATFTYSVTDECFLSDPTPAIFKIPISGTATPPVSRDTTLAPNSLKPLPIACIPLNGTDADGFIVSFRIQTTTSPFDGTLYLDGNPVVINQIIPFEKRGQLYFVPSGNTTGNIFFKYKSVDNDGLQSNLVYHYIPLVNAVPVAHNRQISGIKKGNTIKIHSLFAEDSDGTVISYTIKSLPSLGTLKCDLMGNNNFSNVTHNQNLTLAQAGRLRYVSGNLTGDDIFTYIAKDNLNEESNTATYTIPVTPGAFLQAPVVNNINFATTVSVNAGQTAIAPLTATDIDGNISSYIIQTIPPFFYGKLYFNSGGSVYDSIMFSNKTLTLAQAATLRFRPSGIYAGNVSFSFLAVDDDDLLSNVATYTLGVVALDPVAVDINNTPVSSNAGPTSLLPLSATGGSTITSYIITDLPPANQGVLVMDGSPVTTTQPILAMYANRLEFDPNPSFIGTASFKYTVMENFGAYDKTPATVTIPVINFAPFAVDKASQVITNTLSTTKQTIPALSGYDHDGTIASFRIHSLPSGGTLFVNNIPATINQVLTLIQAGQLSFDPNDHFTGTSVFTFSVADNNNLASIAPATYRIYSNLPPVTTDITENGMLASQPRKAIKPLIGADDVEVTFFSITSLPSSPDGMLYLDNIPVTSLSQVSNLSANQVTQLSFAPSATFNGAIFAYTATDNIDIIDVTPAVYKIPFSNFSTLPVELTTFTGNKSGSDNLLLWTTDQEINSDRFELERSNDGISFKKISTINAKGNTTYKTDYNFIDKNVPGTKQYYRLKMVDIDGKSAYSKIVVIKRDKLSIDISSVVPNPFVGKLSVEITTETSGPAQLQIYDLNGKLVRSTEVKTVKGTNLFKLDDLENLNSGIYILSIRSSDGVANIKLYKGK